MTVYLGPNKYAYFRRMYRLAQARTAARREGNEARRKACNDALERLYRANKGGPHHSLYKP